jgi:hypothetical protein
MAINHRLPPCFFFQNSLVLLKTKNFDDESENISREINCFLIDLRLKIEHSIYPRVKLQNIFFNRKGKEKLRYIHIPIYVLSSRQGIVYHIFQLRLNIFWKKKKRIFFPLINIPFLSILDLLLSPNTN